MQKTIKISSAEVSNFLLEMITVRKSNILQIILNITGWFLLSQVN
jgi:hypothetical protein